MDNIFARFQHQDASCIVSYVSNYVSKEVFVLHDLPSKYIYSRDYKLKPWSYIVWCHRPYLGAYTSTLKIGSDLSSIQDLCLGIIITLRLTLTNISNSKEFNHNIDVLRVSIS